VGVFAKDKDKGTSLLCQSTTFGPKKRFMALTPVAGQALDGRVAPVLRGWIFGLNLG